jgi:hypothetical protein
MDLRLNKRLLLRVHAARGCGLATGFTVAVAAARGGSRHPQMLPRWRHHHLPAALRSGCAMMVESHLGAAAAAAATVGVRSSPSRPAKSPGWRRLQGAALGMPPVDSG